MRRARFTGFAACPAGTASGTGPALPAAQGRPAGAERRRKPVLRMRRAIVAILAGLLSAAGAGHARAADAAACEAYANAAIEKAARARFLNCPIDGSDPRWGTDLGPHLQWCLALPDFSPAQSETDARAVAVAKCSYCRNYQSGAEVNKREAELWNCGFSGPRWDDADDFGWCMGLSSSWSAQYDQSELMEFTGREVAARVEGLKACEAAQQDKADFCHGFVRATDRAVQIIFDRLDACGRPALIAAFNDVAAVFPPIPFAGIPNSGIDGIFSRDGNQRFRYCISWVTHFATGEDALTRFQVSLNHWINTHVSCTGLSPRTRPLRRSPTK